MLRLPSDAERAEGFDGHTISEPIPGQLPYTEATPNFVRSGALLAVELLASDGSTAAVANPPAKLGLSGLSGDEIKEVFFIEYTGKRVWVP